MSGPRLCRVASPLLAILLILSACGTTPGAGPAATATVPAAATRAATASPNYGLRPGAGSPVDGVALREPIEITLWHTQPPGLREDTLKRIIAAFEAGHPGIKVRPEFQDTNANMYKKVLAATNGGGLPDITTGSESIISEYAAAGIVTPLEDYVNSGKYGLTAADLADFYPLYITSNQYPEHGGRLLSFPFTKSTLVMYYNADRLREAGVAVPRTWDEFAAACKRFTGDVKGYAIGINASTFFGAVYSRGGEIITADQAAWTFNNAAGQETLALLQDLVRSGCAYQVEKAYADQSAFGAGRAVFTLDASSGFSFYQDLVSKGGRFEWGVASIPHGAGAAPATVSNGGNIVVLRSTPEKQLAAWEFIKYFTSTGATADWGVATGYLPIRRSALDTETVRAQFARLPAYRVAVTEIQGTGRAEPTVRGTQEARKQIEDAMIAAIGDLDRRPRDLLDEAVRRSNEALKGR